MITMRRQLLGLGFGAASSLLALHAAQAMSGPTAITIDGGPLGSLSVSGGADGYLYALSGAEKYSNSTFPGETTPAGTDSTGANIANALIELQKTTGEVQFTIEVGSNAVTYLGLGPLQTSVQTFSTGPLYAGYITIAPTATPGFTVSAGQINSLEGYEAGVDWNNANQLGTEILYVQNAQSRGVTAAYTTGPFSGTVAFGDGYDTGVWNFLQFLGTYTINSTNAVSVYGGTNLGKTGLAANTYGSALKPYSQTTVAFDGPQYANSDLFGAFYSYTLGNLNVVPEIQYQYAKAQSSLGIYKTTSNFGAAVFGDYSFANTPYSVGAYVEYFGQHSGYDNGTNGVWFIGPNASGEGISITPTWQYKDLFARADVGALYLNTTSSYGDSYGYGSNHDSHVMGVGTLEAGLLF